MLIYIVLRGSDKQLSLLFGYEALMHLYLEKYNQCALKLLRATFSSVWSVQLHLYCTLLA